MQLDVKGGEDGGLRRAYNKIKKRRRLDRMLRAFLTQQRETATDKWMLVKSKRSWSVIRQERNMPAEINRPWNLLRNPGDFKAFIGDTKNKSLWEKYVTTSMTWLHLLNIIKALFRMIDKHSRTLVQVVRGLEN